MISQRFQRLTNSRQASGLSNCINQIVKTVPGIVKGEVEGIDHIMNLIQHHKPTKAIFEGLFLTADMVARVQAYFPNLRLYVHIHSNIPFLTLESTAFAMFKMYQEKGVGIIWNSEDGYDAVEGGLYLPNIYTEQQFSRTKVDDGYLDVACHGSIRPMKNQAIQALAAIKCANLLGKILKFHVNWDRGEGEADAVRMTLKNIFAMHPHHELVKDPWMEHKDFIQHLRTMDIGMQVSLSETFNIVAADYVSAGIPIIVSEEIKWAHEWSKVSTSSVNEISNRMIAALDPRNGLLNAGRESLISHSKLAVASWNEFVNA